MRKPTTLLAALILTSTCSTTDDGDLTGGGDDNGGPSAIETKTANCSEEFSATIGQQTQTISYAKFEASQEEVISAVTCGPIGGNGFCDNIPQNCSGSVLPGIPSCRATFWYEVSGAIYVECGRIFDGVDSDRYSSARLITQ